MPEPEITPLDRAVPQSRRREILGLAVPALGALLADPLVSLVDTAFVARLGPEPLAALGVDAALFNLASWTFIFLAFGTTPMVAGALARGEPERAGRVALNAAWLAGGLGLVVLVLLEGLARPLAEAMGAGPEILPDTLAYLRIRALAAPAVLWITAGNGVYRGLQDTTTPLRLTLALNLVNLVLDPLLIWGAGWGLQGAAWATAAAQWTGALLFAVGLRRRLGPVGSPWPDPGGMRPLVRVGGEMFVRGLALVGTLTLATAVATRTGVLQVAAHQVALQIWLILAYGTDALAVAAQALVARELGRGKGIEARAIANQLLRWGLWLGVGAAGLLWAVRPLLAPLLAPDPGVAAQLALVLPLVILTQPLNAVVFVFDGIFMGAERFRYIALAMVASAAVAWPLLGLTLDRGWGLAGVWAAIAAFMVGRLASMLWAWWGPRAILR